MRIAFKMVNNTAACISIILFCCVLWVACSFPVALSCDSCGRECASACGTRHFRTCCFNYLRKRSSTPPVAPPPPPLMPRGLNLEMWLAKSHLEKPERFNHHRLLDDLASMMGSRNPDMVSENEIDIEQKDGTSSNREGFTNKRNPVIATHTNHVGKYRLHRLDNDQDSHDSDQKTSEEFDPGKLQLLYDA